MIPGLGRSPGEGNGYPFQYSGLQNLMDRGTWQATYSPWGHKELDMTKRLSLVMLPLLIHSTFFMVGRENVLRELFKLILNENYMSHAEQI